MDFVGLLAKLGWPAAALVMLGWFFWRGLWPWFQRQIDSSQKILTDQIKSSQEDQREQKRDFLEALASLQRSQDRRDVAFEQIVQRLDRITGLLEKGRTKR